MNYRIIFIAGAARSGSTFLETRLADSRSTVAVGELGYIWDRGVAQNHQCSCGQAFWSCPFWSEVMDRAFGARDGAGLAEMLAIASRVSRIRRVPQIRYPALRTGVFARELARYESGVRRLYDAIHATAGATTIIDSSKYPHLAVVPSVFWGNVEIIHLVRDCRAVAHAWSKAKTVPGHGQHAAFGTWSASKASWVWTRSNLGCEAVAAFVPVRRIRYEDIGSDIEQLRAALDLEGSTGRPLVHSFSGNPIRFGDAGQTFRLDERWIDELATRDQWTATALSWPLLVHYGYRLRTRAAAASGQSRAVRPHRPARSADRAATRSARS